MKKVYLLLLSALFPVFSFSQAHYWSPTNSNIIPKICPGNPDIFVDQPTDWQIYQTLDNTWNGPIDSAYCIEASNYNGGFRFSLDQIDTSKSVFIRYKFTENNKVLLFSNELYFTETSIGAINASPDYSTNCPEGICTGLLTGIQVPDEDGTGFNLREYYGGFQTGEYFKSTCVPTEYLESYLREYVLILNVGNIEGPAEEAFFTVNYSSLNIGWDVAKVYEVFVPQAFYTNGNYEAAMYDLIGGFYTSYLMMYGDWGTYPSDTTQFYIDVVPEFNPDSAVDINLEIYGYESIVFQPFTQLRGALVSGSDTSRHHVNLVNNGGNACIPSFIEVLLQDGMKYVHHGGQIELQGKTSCMQFRDGGALVVGSGETLHYGPGGFGILNLRTGGTIRLEPESELIIDNDLKLMSYPPGLTDQEQAQVYMDLPPDTRLTFGENARLTAPFGGRDYMRLNIHMLGGEIDLSKLDAESRALINLIYPDPEGDPSANLKLMPNPAAGITQVDWLSATEEIIRISLIDLQGRLIRNMEFPAQKGSNQIDLPLGNIPAGMYFVRIDAPSQGQAVQQLVITP